MKIKELVDKLEGVQTIESVMDILGAGREKAVYCIYRLRKRGYVRTRRLSSNKRAYYVSVENRLGGKSYYEVINENSPVKVSTPAVHRVYGKKLSFEETFIYALNTKSFRTVLAALALFRKISNWTELYGLAKANHLERQVGVIYDLARVIMRVRRMPKNFRRNALPKEGCGFEYIIPGIKSEDFAGIENMWRVHLPFNKKDLEAYK